MDTLYQIVSVYGDENNWLYFSNEYCYDMQIHLKIVNMFTMIYLSDVRDSPE